MPPPPRTSLTTCATAARTTDLSIVVDAPPPPPPAACAVGIQKGQAWSSGLMRTCLAPGPVNQCNAEALCNLAGGWHLCSASEYLARGGKTEASTDYGWLASCVRSDGKAPKAPSDSRCALW